MDWGGALQSSRVAGYVVAKDYAPHARLAGARLAHEQHLLLLGLLDLAPHVRRRRRRRGAGALGQGVVQVRGHRERARQAAREGGCPKRLMIGLSCLMVWIMRARVLRMGTGVVESKTVDRGEIEEENKKKKNGYSTTS